MSILSDLIPIFNRTSITAPTICFVDTDKQILKVMWKSTRPGRANMVLAKNKGRIYIIPFKTSYQAIVMMVAWYQRKNRGVINGVEERGHTHKPPSKIQSANRWQWHKGSSVEKGWSFSEWSQDNWTHTCTNQTDKIELCGRHSTPFTEMNSTYILNLNVKWKLLNGYKKRNRRKFGGPWVWKWVFRCNTKPTIHERLKWLSWTLSIKNSCSLWERHY